MQENQVSIAEVLRQRIGLRFKNRTEYHTRYGLPVCAWRQGGCVQVLVYLDEQPPMTLLLRNLLPIYALESLKPPKEVDLKPLLSHVTNTVPQYDILWKIGGEKRSSIWPPQMKTTLFKRTSSLHLDYKEMTLLSMSHIENAGASLATEIMRNYELHTEQRNHDFVAAFVQATITHMSLTEVIAGWDVLYQTYFRQWHPGRGMLHDARFNKVSD